MFSNTKRAIEVFQNAIACAKCDKSQSDLQYLGTSCKHAFCWDCISHFENPPNKKRNYSPSCPRCAMPLYVNKITGASVLKNCFDNIAEVLKLIPKLEIEKISMTQADMACTQRIFENFGAQMEKGRTIDEFLLTQPPDLDEASEECDIRRSSESPELDAFAEYSKIENKTRSSIKRPASRLSDIENENKAKRPPTKKEKETFELFGTQVPHRQHDNTTLTPFVQRRSTAPSVNNSNLVSIFAEPLRSKSSKETSKTEDAFSKKVTLTRRNESKENVALEMESVDKTKSIRKSSTTSNKKTSGLQHEDENDISSTSKLSKRQASPSSSAENVILKTEPRRSSFGTRRGEVVIVNSILNNRIPQLKSAIEAGTCVNEKENLKTPLYVAVENGNLAAVEVLVEAGAIINASCENSCETALHEAVRKNNYPIVKFLLSRGASMKLKNSWGHTAEQLISDENKKLKKAFDLHRDNHVLQTFIPPRRPIIHFVLLIDDKILTEDEKRKLPGKINIVNSDMNNPTHVVVDVCPKTKVLIISKENLADILRAIMKTAALIVSSKWLKDCTSKPQKVDDDRNYVVEKVRLMDGEVYEGTIQKWKKAIDRMQPKLFAGCRFFFLRAKYTYLDRPALLELIRAGGGQAFPREPLISANDPPPYHNSSLKPHFIVYSINHAVPDKYRDANKFTLVCEQWIIEAILQFSISKAPY